MLPLRTTFTSSSSLTLFRTSNFLFALTSKAKPMQVASMIATKIPIGSNKTERPSSCAKNSYKETPTDNAKAINKILMIGSLNFSIN